MRIPCTLPGYGKLFVSHSGGGNQRTSAFWAVLLVLCSAALCLFAPANSALASDGNTHPQPVDTPQGPQSVLHGKFTVLFSRFWDAGTDSGHDVNIFYDGNLLPNCGGSVRWSNVEEFSHDSCSTLDITLFTGGASCCYGTYLLTSCDGRDQAIILNNERFTLEKAPKGLGAEVRFSLLDTAFVGYSKEAASGMASLQFSHANSPAMQRLVLFDGDSWRTDRPGEYPEYYLALIEKAAGLTPERDEDRTAQAMLLAYFALMSGENAETAFETFVERLPTVYGELAEQVFMDIQAATRNDARPLARIDLQSQQAARMHPHTVLPGETLHSIGREYGVAPGEIYQSNPQLQDPNLLRVGEVLRIPPLPDLSPQAGQAGEAGQYGQTEQEQVESDANFEEHPAYEQEQPVPSYLHDDAFTGDEKQRQPAPSWPGQRQAPRRPARSGQLMAGLP